MSRTAVCAALTALALAAPGLRADEGDAAKREEIRKLAEAVRHMKKLPSLRAVTLGFTKVTDAGLAHLAALPALTQLDLTGPFEVFGRLSDAQVLLVGDREVRSDTGLFLRPDVGLADAPQLDVLCVPGGPGVNAAMEDAALLAFLRSQAERATWVTSVCTGALVLGAAGLLRGYRATTHWLSLDLLAPFGATAVRERVVVDRNRVTGGGVTAGIDFGLRLAAELRGERAAKEI